MYTVPILDQKVDWAMIDSCIQHVEVKLMGMGSLSQILDLRASQLPLEFKILGQDRPEEEKYWDRENIPLGKIRDMKNNSVKFQIFDTVTNGGKYFYHSQRPGCDLQ